MGVVANLIAGFVLFGRNSIGIAVRPYETYRRIIDRGSVWELVYIGILLAFYFALASIVKTAAFRPFLLTKEFLLLYTGAASGFFLTVALFRFVKPGKNVGIAWAYTLIPTVLWFFVTSLLYVLLPPPRTTSIAGTSFSIVFLIFSATLLWWKITLSYLTLRFGLKLDLFKILAVFAVCLPAWGLWSYMMYRLGIFKVPFL